MKKNVILSTVAATVVAGFLLAGCNSTEPQQKDQGYESVGKVNVVAGENGVVNGTNGTTGKEVKTENGNTTLTVKSVRDCVDANNQPAPCVQVCTPTNPCQVTVTTKCPSKLSYANGTDISGAWNAYNNAGDANVVAERNDATTIATFSGTATVSQTGGIGSCGFDFSSFIVCAVTKNKGLHYYNTSTNSAGYVLVLVEYDDGTKEWKKVPVTRKNNGTENDQPFIELTGLNGKVPAKLTVFSILKVGAPATGSSGSTGTIGAGD